MLKSEIAALISSAIEDSDVVEVDVLKQSIMLDMKVQFAKRKKKRDLINSYLELSEYWSNFTVLDSVLSPPKPNTFLAATLKE